MMATVINSDSYKILFRIEFKSQSLSVSKMDEYVNLRRRAIRYVEKRRIVKIFDVGMAILTIYRKVVSEM